MRLIDADALMDAMRDEEFQTFVPLDEVDSVIDKSPTIEAEPVRHGKWLMITDSKHCGVCSVCFRQDYIDPIATHCRYCGAKMDLEG